MASRFIDLVLVLCGQGVLALFAPATRTELRIATKLWQANRAQALHEYGDIASWDTSRVTDMHAMFRNAKDFNDDIGSWNTSRVTDMRFMFLNAAAFNQDISRWDTSNVANMQGMMVFASAFNQDLRKWNTASVSDMSYMFYRAESFAQDLSAWNTHDVETIDAFCYGARCFGQCPSCLASEITATLAFAWCMVLLWACGCEERCRPKAADERDRAGDESAALSSSAASSSASSATSAVPEASAVPKRGCSTPPCFRPKTLADAVPWPEVASDCTDPFREGRRLHEAIGAEKWGITREDLDLFEKEVRTEWKAGNIKNTFPASIELTPAERDKVEKDFNNPAVGPNMYQVTQQFIKPFTAKYGGMSFALMLHPDGLDVNGFTTHAWSEGVFEFVDQVRRGWPSDCTGMYICFLANPQNGTMVDEILDKTIEESPFYHALDKATHMLVVPNSSGTSIYTRLWCCYEAFLAYTKQKVIVLPAPKVHIVSRVVVCFIVFAGFLVCPSFLNFDEDTFRLMYVLWAILSAAWVGVATLRCWTWCTAWWCWEKVLQVVTIIGLVAFAYIGLCKTAAITFLEEDEAGNNHVPTVLLVNLCSVKRVIPCIHLVVLMVHEATARGVRSAQENRARLHFNSLAEAKCFSEEDKNKIQAAIRGKEEKVQDALGVLMRQGMFYKEMVRSGVDSSTVGLADGVGYLDVGLVLIAAVLVPAVVCLLVYLGAAEGLDGEKYFLMSFVAAVVAYVIGAWAYCCGDPDLTSWVLRATPLSLGFTLICGFFVGLEGVAGGLVYATCMLARKRSVVQKAQRHRLLDVMGPVTVLCWSFLSWQVLVLVEYREPCSCTKLGLAEAVGAFSFWPLVAWAGARQLTRSSIRKVTCVAFFAWVELNCFVTAGHLASMVEERENFLKDFWTWRLLWSASSLAVVGIVFPLHLLALEWMRARRRVDSCWNRCFSSRAPSPDGSLAGALLGSDDLQRGR